jgi:hypothetical protein
MAKFTVRVVLHKIKNLDHDSYTKLHAAMEAANFKRYIESEDAAYQLPPAEYNYIGSKSREEVREEASAIATKIDVDSGVLVTEGVRVWSGLKKVDL